MLTPIVATTNSGARVESFLALNQGAASATSLQAVWYIKDDSSQCSWNAKTWMSTDPWDAIKTVKVYYNIPDSDDGHWGTTIFASSTSSPKATFDYSKGFIADNALGRDINSLTDRDEWVDWLVIVGYKAANVSFEKAVLSTDPAYPSTVLSQYAAAVEAMNAQTAPANPPPGSIPTPATPLPPYPSGQPPASTPPPVNPGTLPGGPIPPAWTPPPTFCCTPMTFHIRQAWSGYIRRGGWDGPVNCGTSNGHPACCRYKQLICRYYQRWAIVITCSPPTFTYTLDGVTEECWAYSVDCNAQPTPSGAWLCAAVPGSGLGCNADPNPPVGPPLPGVTPDPFKNY